MENQLPTSSTLQYATSSDRAESEEKFLPTKVNHPEGASIASEHSTSHSELEQLLPSFLPLQDRSSTRSKENSLCTVTIPVVNPKSNSSITLITSKVIPVKRTPSSELLNVPVTNKPKKQVNTGRACVLTSAECLKALQEKENIKQQKAEEKERRQQERILKKKQKEDELKQKQEEKIRKAAIKQAQSTKGKGTCKQCITKNTTESIAGPSSVNTTPCHSYTKIQPKRKMDEVTAQRQSAKRIKYSAD